MKRNILAFISALAAIQTGGSRISTASVEHPLRDHDPPIALACQRFLHEPRSAISVVFRWDQRLSFASCRQSGVVQRIERGDVGALPRLIARLERDVAPSITVYSDAMSFAPPELKIVGAYWLGATYLAIVVRAREAIEPDDSVSRRALEPLLAADLRAAMAAFDEVGFLAEDNPRAAAANPVVISVVARAHEMRVLLAR
jgi:hypothetical protein